jgi:hypothetical protein
MKRTSRQNAGALVRPQAQAGTILGETPLTKPRGYMALTFDDGPFRTGHLASSTPSTATT